MSKNGMVALRRVGFEAISYDGPRDADALAGWFPADLHLGGGLPGLQRVTLGCGTDELALRAFLNHPVSLCAHDAVANGFGSLESAVDRARAVGAKWMSREEMTRANYWHRVTGTTLHIRSHTRRAVVAVPGGLDSIVVELPPGEPQPIVHEIDASRIEVLPPPKDPIAAEAVSPPRWTPWPIAGRVAVERRDRVLPLAHRMRPQRFG
jgi:hypothetical protein